MSEIISDIELADMERLLAHYEKEQPRKGVLRWSNKEMRNLLFTVRYWQTRVENQRS